jgi:hypothetical protein
VLDAGWPFSRSFSYAKAGATADKARADAKAIVTSFTVLLRCSLMQDGCLAGAACDANSRHAQGVTNHKIRRFVHANVMALPTPKNKSLAINDSAAALRRNADSRNAVIPEKQTCHARDACYAGIFGYVLFM